MVARKRARSAAGMVSAPASTSSALPRMAADLGSTTTDMQWVVSIYMLVLGAFMVPAAKSRKSCGHDSSA